MSPSEPFDLQATVSLVWNALSAVVCTIGFQAAVHGLLVALVIALFGMYAMRRQSKTARPLIVVFKKISLFCLILALPGMFCIVTSGKLPRVNELVLNSFGLIGLWALITAHLCMEEMNFQWFDVEEQS